MNTPLDINAKKVEQIKNNILKLTEILNNLYSKEQLFTYDINLNIENFMVKKENIISQKEMEILVAKIFNVQNIKDLIEYNQEKHKMEDMVEQFKDFFESKSISEKNSLILALASSKLITDISSIYYRKSSFENNYLIEKEDNRFISLSKVIDKSSGLVHLETLLSDIQTNKKQYSIKFKKYMNFYFIDIYINLEHLMKIDNFLVKKDVYALLLKHFIGEQDVDKIWRLRFNNFIKVYFDFIFFLKNKEKVNNKFILENTNLDNLLKLIKKYKMLENKEVKNILEWIHCLPGFKDLDSKIIVNTYENYGYLIMQAGNMLEALNLLNKKEKNILFKHYYNLKTLFLKNKRSKKIFSMLNYLENNLDINKKETYITAFTSVNSFYEHLDYDKKKEVKLLSVV